MLQPVKRKGRGGFDWVPNTAPRIDATQFAMQPVRQRAEVSRACLGHTHEHASAALAVLLVLPCRQRALV